MAELDIVSTWTCKTNIDWHCVVQSNSGKKYLVCFERQGPNADVQYDYTCTCPAFKYNKGYCKHIKLAMPERCGWNGELEPTAEALVKDGEHVCPDCEGPIAAVRVGV